MTTTGNLIVENRQGDFLISGKSDFTLVKFATDKVGYLDESENGQIRIYKRSSDDFTVIIFAAMQKTEAEEPVKNLRAVARLTNSELKSLFEIAMGVAGINTTTEVDVLRSRIQDLEEEIQGLNLLLKDRSDHLQEVLEG